MSDEVKTTMVVDKIAALIEDDHSAPFTDDEKRVLRKVIKIMKGAEALVWFGGGVRKLLIWIGIVGGSLMAFSDHFKAWLKGLL